MGRGLAPVFIVAIQAVFMAISDWPNHDSRIIGHAKKGVKSLGLHPQGFGDPPGPVGPQWGEIGAQDALESQKGVKVGEGLRKKFQRAPE